MHCICICAYFRSDELLALAFIYIYMCIYIHMYIDVLICIYVHIYIYLHVYIYVCIHIHIHIHMHIRVDLYTCIHKHTLTHTFLLTGDEADGNHLSGVRRFLHVDQHGQRLAQHWQLQINSRYFAQPVVYLCVSSASACLIFVWESPQVNSRFFAQPPLCLCVVLCFLCLFGNPLKETLSLLI